MRINSSEESIEVSALLELIEQIHEGLINLQQQDAHELFSAISTSLEHVENQNKKVDLLSSIH